MKACVELAIKSKANLSEADLSKANLSWADLSWADLSKADPRCLRHIKHDIWGILLRAIPEVPALRLAIVEGRIDGSCYSGECACLCGTIANIQKCDVYKLDYTDNNSMAERWFMGIQPGDTPEKNSAAKLAVEWIDEFTALLEASTKPV